MARTNCTNCTNSIGDRMCIRLFDGRIHPNQHVYQYAWHHLHSVEQCTGPFIGEQRQEMILQTQYTYSMPLILENPGTECLFCLFLSTVVEIHAEM